MKKIDDLIMKVKKFFHQDPESLELKREQEHLKRERELQEIRELIAEYERRVCEEDSEKVEPRRRSERKKKPENEKETGNQKEHAD